MSYVGQTRDNFGDRRDCHYATLRGGYHYSPQLQIDWNKYGEDSFEFNIIKICDCESELNTLEEKYIKDKKENNTAYNTSDGVVARGVL